jgi:hypothetical protein
VEFYDTPLSIFDPCFHNFQCMASFCKGKDGKHYSEHSVGDSSNMLTLNPVKSYIVYALTEAQAVIVEERTYYLCHYLYLILYKTN